MKKILLISAFSLLLTSLAALANQPEAKQFHLSVALAEVDDDNYHEPYVAIWLETSDRKPISTLAVWYRANKGEKWLKDIRQWWRKAGSHNLDNVDSVTGATKKPGTYLVNWNGLDDSGEVVVDGDYVLHVEAVREKGGREHLRVPITLPLNQTQLSELLASGKSELGDITFVPQSKKQ